MFAVVPIKGKGRGLIATQPISKGTIIEEAPLIILDKKDSKLVEKTLLGNYTFEYDSKRVCLALGYRSLYKHDEAPNVEAILYNDQKTYLVYEALRDIEEGEELLINYGYKVK